MKLDDVQIVQNDHEFFNRLFRSHRDELVKKTGGRKITEADVDVFALGKDFISQPDTLKAFKDWLFTIAGE